MSLKPLAGEATALEWFKSSHSNPDGAACIEIAPTPTTIHVRDSKHLPGPQLAFGPHQWSAFVSYAATTRCA
ncbi:DUF397 domain-containing protein [Streptomyces sp. SID13726]|uniref:DUF397 domain-containing protein n=1 Tax=Streptomyces sp. SID13726 TaxID=2706058 RepID=UPI0013B8C953|nr:DUF397 domain-containing protein [Streptomyces sp. SID13726]NEB00355.1 DUF397 domain-containing protein [Streptomyces sp. SID13726]